MGGYQLPMRKNVYMIYDFIYSLSSLKVLGSVNHGLIGHCWMVFAISSHSHIVFFGWGAIVHSCLTIY